MRLKRAYVDDIEVLKWNWTFGASGESGSSAYPSMSKRYLSFPKQNSYRVKLF